ncbi:unnamed protein product [Bursaphelenchus okinawaensis]|uniref:Tyrosine-protein kinase n=1 Tax=Bursaphelenchus okinawaensis TaxID=465554 RepID=A0A811KM05_9BILA|nr:unnamed protein product [Bursaphelenchus okinawaensis]CAG9107372.1 unnamed protein product [Bursaphelenchus okinawaensis]
MSQPDAELIHEPYYHGFITREDVAPMLEREGDFIVRLSEPTGENKRGYVVSSLVYLINNEKTINHFVVKEENGQFAIDKEFFASISAMIKFYTKTEEPVIANPSNPLETGVLRRGIGRQSWELDQSLLFAGPALGEGAFGEVRKGKIKLPNGEFAHVAIKYAKSASMTKTNIKDFMNEARMLRQFDHPNIIKFYGVAATEEPLLLVMELADAGSLTGLCYDASQGLDHIHKKNIIHRDIAARNCLCSGGSVKISDFGMARPGPVYRLVDEKAKVPIKWLAPEAMGEFVYSYPTDVWAFGLLCWEMYTKQEPYNHVSVADVIKKVKKEKKLLSFPKETPQEMADIIINGCWSYKPEKRASMHQIGTLLAELLKVYKTKPETPQQDSKIGNALSLIGQSQCTPSASPAAPTNSKSKKRKQTKNKKKKKIIRMLILANKYFLALNFELFCNNMYEPIPLQQQYQL